MVFRLLGFLAFSAQQNAECAIWYNPAKSVTQTKLMYCGKLRKSLRSRNFIPRWVENFQDCEIVQVQR